MPNGVRYLEWTFTQEDPSKLEGWQNLPFFPTPTYQMDWCVCPPDRCLKIERAAIHLHYSYSYEVTEFLLTIGHGVVLPRQKLFELAQQNVRNYYAVCPGYHLSIRNSAGRNTEFLCYSCQRLITVDFDHPTLETWIDYAPPLVIAKDEPAMLSYLADIGNGRLPLVAIPPNVQDAPFVGPVSYVGFEQLYKATKAAPPSLAQNGYSSFMD